MSEKSGNTAIEENTFTGAGKVVENTATPNAPNIATTDENASIDTIFQQSKLPSLGRQIFSVLPIHGPTAALFNIKNNLTNDATLVRANISVENSTSIPTGMTQEVIQDIRAQYGKEANNIIGKLLRGLANDQENVTTAAFLAAQSLAGPSLTRTAPANAETSYFEVTQRVHELVLEMNSLNLRTYEAFAVLPYKIAASFMSLNKYIGADDGERGLFVSKVGKTKFYMNPNSAATDVYVGLIDSDNPSKSSGVFSPYAANIVDAINENSGENTYHIFNRYAVTASPLHVAGEEMFHSFTVL